MNYFNIIEIIFHEKSTLQVSEKLGIASDYFHECIHNGVM